MPVGRNLLLIYHIAKKEEWQKAKREGEYRPRSLESQGFIHCSRLKQLIKVANYLYRGEKDLVLLAINSDKVHSKIREESPGTSPETYPHIYGTLNLDSVVEVIPLEPDREGLFKLPKPTSHLNL